jgi:hypothetical protein
MLKLLFKYLYYLTINYEYSKEMIKLLKISFKYCFINLFIISYFILFYNKILL